MVTPYSRSAISMVLRSMTLCRRLPGGEAMMSMPLASGSLSSSSVMPALPPPNSVANVPWKFVLMAVNASRKRACVVSSILLIASVVCAIESIRSWR